MGMGCLRRHYDTLSLYNEEEQTIASLQEAATLVSSPPWSAHEVPTTSSSLESLSERTLRFKSLQEI